MPPTVHRLDLPLPWELGQINVYLLDTGDGWMLIDCGMDTEEAWTSLNAQLGKAGVRMADIRAVLLTHMHPDHMGQAPRILEATGARLYMHRVEQQLLADTVKAIRHGVDFDNALEEALTPETLQQKVRLAFTEVQSTFRHLSPDVLLDGGERLGPAEVMWTPGHSAGHVCLHLDGGDLIAGDHLLENITPNISWMPDQDCLGQFIDSLERVAAREVAMVYPSHGEPFRGHREWVTQTIAHHHERCDEIIAALHIRGRSAHELVAVLWPRRLSAFHYRFAVYEVLAHLEFLRARGKVLVHNRIWSSTTS